MEQKFSTGRFMGLLQTDGNFSFLWDTDKTFRPRVMLTVGEPNKKLMENEVIPWLNENGIICQVHKTTTSNYSDSYNIVVERKQQVAKLISLIDEASKEYPTLLVDTKLVQFLALKKAFALTDEKASKKTKQEKDIFNKVLVDLKINTLKVNAVQTKTNVIEERFKLEQRFGITGSEGSATTLWQGLISEANQKSAGLLTFLTKKNENCGNCSVEIGDYMAGIVEGDGSFQVGFHTSKKRDFLSFEFQPMMTLTDGYVITNQHYMFLLFNQFFGNVTQAQAVGQGKKADRIYVKSRAVNQKAILFFNDKELGKHTNRFKVFKYVVENYDAIHKSQQLSNNVIDLIEKYFSANRTYSPQESKLIIKNYFDYKNKKGS